MKAGDCYGLAAAFGEIIRQGIAPEVSKALADMDTDYDFTALRRLHDFKNGGGGG